jgi:putative membrane protein insertion efficiency factor
VKLLLVSLIRVYQLTLSPILGGACRFEPSCSSYAIEAIDRHGAWKGMRLAAARLLRCHPFGSAGYDPVPDAEEGGHGHGR